MRALRASKAQREALELIHNYATRGIPIAAGTTPQGAPTARMTTRTWTILLRNGWVEFHGEPVNRYGHRAVRLTDAGHAQLPTTTEARP